MKNARTSESPHHNRWIRGFAAYVAVGGLVAAAACAEGDVSFETNETGEGGNPVTTTTGGSGGGGAAPSPCGIDCSAIEAPDCQVGVCDIQTGQCAIVPDDDGVACDDGLFCTISDTCQTGTCVGGPANDCGMAPAECETVSCDEQAQTCTTSPVPNGGTCTHTNPCMLNTTCTNGVCLGTLNECFFEPVPSECYNSVCNPMNGICEPQIGNNGAPCIDPNALCDDGKTCDNGNCIGGFPKDCSGLNADCVVGVCDTNNGQCVTQSLPMGSMCMGAADDCNDGECDANGMCQPVPINENGMCEDGNPCTSGETCTSGTCSGGTMVNQVVYFQEDFANNNAGWTLDTEWQIGSAMASPPSPSCGNPDPAADNTPTSDNGVAGVVIGGTAATNIHTWYYATSPVVNTAAVVGPMWLGFYRWLNSDWTPFMQNRVEVYDGTQWVVLWQSEGFPGIADSAWTQQAFDISAYKNAQMRLRFGFEIANSGVFTCSQWNLDDVVVANVVCP